MVVDPIDGTSNFARGAPQFCVSIACLSDGAIEAGVVYDPMRDELFSALRGSGAFLNGERIRPSEATSLANSAIEVGWNARAGVAKYLDLIRRVALCCAAPFRSGSGALGLEHHIRAWDCLSAILIVREAGGYASDFLANDGLAKGNPILVAAPGVKDALIAVAELEGIAL